MNATAVEVAKLLLENNVILLPTIKDVLMSYVHKYSTKHSADLTTTKQSITSRWILSHLTVNLKHHITYKCTTRKYSTLVYRPNTDFMNTTASYFGNSIKVRDWLIPSDNALLLHWKRSCWVLHMWQQSDQPIMTLENYGWSITVGVSQTMSSPLNGILPPTYRLSVIESTHSLKDASVRQVV